MSSGVCVSPVAAPSPLSSWGYDNSSHQRHSTPQPNPSTSVASVARDTYTTHTRITCTPHPHHICNPPTSPIHTLTPLPTTIISPPPYIHTLPSPHSPSFPLPPLSTILFSPSILYPPLFFHHPLQCITFTLHREFCCALAHKNNIKYQEGAKPLIN